MNVRQASPTRPTLTGQLRRALRASQGTPAEAGPPLQQPAATRPTGPALLAQTHAAPRARREARALYTRCLGHYRQHVQQGASHDDVALAAAFFVLANLAVLQDIEPDAQQLALVERQMRHRLGQFVPWQQAPLPDRQSAFEQFAVLGVLIAESGLKARAQGPAAIANVREAARSYLRQLAGLNPERLSLGEQGLVLALDDA